MRALAYRHCDLPNIAKPCPNLRQVYFKCKSYSDREQVYKNIQQLLFITKIDIYSILKHAFNGKSLIEGEVSEEFSSENDQSEATSTESEEQSKF